MVFFCLVIATIFIIVIIAAIKKKAGKTNQVPEPGPVYPQISQKEFEALVKQSARRIKRISALHIERAKVFGEVTSQSGISTWKFSLDFGDITRLTGDCQKRSGNPDSDIPKILASSIRDAIKDYPNTRIDLNYYFAFCPCCYKRLSNTKGQFCMFCGEQFYC